MSRTPHLRLVHDSEPATWGDGFLTGHEDGYEQGRRDRGLELAVVGFLAGVIACAVLVWVLR